MGRRTWIKIYSEKWLRGTLRDEASATRGIWMDVLAMAGDSFFGDEGTIKFSNNMGYTDTQIADLLHIKIDEWVVAKDRLVKTDRIKIHENNVIAINNWRKYQSEYERQKKYRPKNQEKSQKLQSEVTAKVTRRREKREERRENKEKNTWFWLIDEWQKLAVEHGQLIRHQNIEKAKKNKRLLSVIAERVKEHSGDEILQSFINYDKFLRLPADRKRWKGYRWTMFEFLARGKDNVARFADWELIKYNWLEPEKRKNPLTEV